MRWPWLETVRQVIESSWAARKCWLWGSFRSPETTLHLAILRKLVEFG